MLVIVRAALLTVTENASLSSSAGLSVPKTSSPNSRLTSVPLAVTRALVITGGVVSGVLFVTCRLLTAGASLLARSLRRSLAVLPGV